MNMFPFSSIREGQREFMEDIESCLKGKLSLVANAPTGIGKTAATLAPCLEYALKNSKTIFFLTPKHSQHKIVIDTLANIRKKFGVEFSVVDIIGKKWLCPVPSIEMLSTSDFADYCNSVKKDEKCVFYNNTRNKEGLSKKTVAILEGLQTTGPLHAEDMKELCKGLCPYEISLEASKRSHVIICDYYHIFSNVRNTFLRRTGKELKDAIIIVDEAHNLPERIRKTLSGKISTHSLGYAEKEAQAFGFHDLAEDIMKIEKILKAMPRQMKEEKEIFVKKDDFMKELDQIRNVDELLEDLQAAALEIRESRKKSVIGNLAKFLELWQGEDMGFARILKRELRNGKPVISLNYACLDPMVVSKDIMQDVHSAILMSGTLTPMEMHKNLLGMDEKTLCKEYQSSFPSENRMNIILPDVTTQYSKRTDSNTDQMANHIVNICNSMKGNAAVFFPSYEMREILYRIIADRVNKIIFLEKPEMAKEEKAAMFNGFMNCPNGLLLGTQGGSFAEGVDYFGGVLKCVMVVGISLSHPDLETKALINYYDYKFHRGWDYGYIYPAVHRAMQSAGRCIRTEKDRAVVVFMDNRFLWKNYRVVFPVTTSFAVTETPEKLIKEFFDVEYI